MKYLVTGLAGSGKSAIARNLRERGYNAFDGDRVPDLSSWTDKNTGESIEVDLNNTDYSKIAWSWDRKTLANLVLSNPNLILCGSATNALACFTYFDKVFILTLDPETQKHRIMSRLDNNYGQHPDALRMTLENQISFANESIKLGAIAIDAIAPLNNVVEQILNYVDER
ncbi:MAG: AAA family ATPase [Candidatus Saccharimonadales bacterium]